jgi:hypothetical protein
MNLPNYFLADLPPEAVLSPAMLAEACQTLKRNRECYLLSRSTESLIKVLSDVADGWLGSENKFRKLALELGPARAGFSRETLARGLDNFFKQITRENIHALLVQEFGDAKRLDAMTMTAAEQKQNRLAMVNTPEFQVHIAAGNIPNPALTSIVFGLLTRSAQFVKCASGASFLPRLFAHSIYEADGKLGACLEIAEWRGGNLALENALFAEADCVTATGSDETLDELRKRVPLRTRFLGHGHRVSFGFVAGEVLYGSRGKKLSRRRRMTSLRGINSAVCRRTSSMSSLAARLRRSISPNCWRKNWNVVRPASRAANYQRNMRQRSHCVAIFTKCARRICRRRRSIGAAKIRPRGR